MIEGIKCNLCHDGDMEKHTTKKDSAGGLFLMLIAFVLFWVFPIGTVLSIGIFILAALTGIKKNKYLVCDNCDYRVDAA